MNRQEIEIWNDLFRFCQLFSLGSPENDGHRIFQMAFAACQIIERHNRHPLAIRLSQALVEYYIDQNSSSRWRDGVSGIGF